MRKARGPQKGLPNSARDLLPMLQPATKALAQMLAGRTQVSGQLEQARAVLGQAERLIADRVHNRLNPAEREEFFEQLARLRLTLADAADEAEARATEEQTPQPAPAPPVAQERLREMALALATPEGARRRAAAGVDDGVTSPRLPALEVEEDGTPLSAAGSATNAPAPAEVTDESGGVPPAREDSAAQPADAPRRLLAINKAGRLELPKEAAASASQNVSGMASRAAARRRSAATKPAVSVAAPAPTPGSADAAANDEHAGNGAVDAEEKTKPVRRSRKTKTGLPEGWIIDEEGFVVPGPS